MACEASPRHSTAYGNNSPATFKELFALCYLHVLICTVKSISYDLFLYDVYIVHPSYDLYV